MRQPEPIWISFEDEDPPSRRTLDAAILGRLPQARRALVRLTLRLPRRSGLRQALLRRSVLQVQGAWMRGDFELALDRTPYVLYYLIGSALAHVMGVANANVTLIVAYPPGGRFVFRTTLS